AAERAPEPDRDQEAAPDHDRAQADHEDGQQRQDAAPTPWQPLSMAEARAGYGPAAREAAPQVRAIHQRQIELRDELAERREAEREAAGRLARGRLRLLLEGTTPSQVRAEHQKAGENVRGIFEEQAELGQREQQIRSQAIARDMEQARADAERQRREQEIQGLERGALSRGLTLNELRTMEREEFDRLRTRTALESSRIGSTLHRDPPSKIDLQEQEKRERAGPGALTICQRPTNGLVVPGGSPPPGPRHPGREPGASRTCATIRCSAGTPPGPNPRLRPHTHPSRQP